METEPASKLWFVEFRQAIFVWQSSSDRRSVGIFHLQIFVLHAGGGRHSSGLVVGKLSTANPVCILSCGNFRSRCLLRELPFGMSTWEFLHWEPNLAKLGGGCGSWVRNAGKLVDAK